MYRLLLLNVIVVLSFHVFLFSVFICIISEQRVMSDEQMNKEKKKLIFRIKNKSNKPILVIFWFQTSNKLRFYFVIGLMLFLCWKKINMKWDCCFGKCSGDTILFRIYLMKRNKLLKFTIFLIWKFRSLTKYDPKILITFN